MRILTSVPSRVAIAAVEGLYWEEAQRDGFIDATTSVILQGDRAGSIARDAHDVFRALPINDRVRRSLSRYAFGSEANAFRHGRVGAWGARHQCAIWILALVAWLDGAGWRNFSGEDLRRLRGETS